MFLSPLSTKSAARQYLVQEQSGREAVRFLSLHAHLKEYQPEGEHLSDLVELELLLTGLASAGGNSSLKVRRFEAVTSLLTLGWGGRHGHSWDLLCNLLSTEVDGIEYWMWDTHEEL